MELIKSIVTKNPCYTAGKKIAVKGLMLHSVGCPQPSAKVFVNMFDNASYNTACVHGFIDANDGKVYQTLPWNHRGWHGGGSSNNTHIGVEMCEPSCIKYTGGATFTCSDLTSARASAKKTYESAVELFAYLCKEYNLNPLGDGVIVSHKEGSKRGIASNHGDPEHLWSQLGTGYTMDGFRKDVKNKMDGGLTMAQYEELTKTITELKKEVDSLKNTIVNFEKTKEKVYNYNIELPDWGRPTIEKLLANGLYKGESESNLNLPESLLRTLVINDRAGLYD